MEEDVEFLVHQAAVAFGDVGVPAEIVDGHGVALEFAHAEFMVLDAFLQVGEIEADDWEPTRVGE